MKTRLRSTKRMALIVGSVSLALVILHLLLAPGVGAQSGGPYNLTWSTVDGGGETFSTGGGHRLGGTAGQPDAGLLTGGPYMLRGGFWVDGLTIPIDYEYDTYLPLVLR